MTTSQHHKQQPLSFNDRFQVNLWRFIVSIFKIVSKKDWRKAAPFLQEKKYGTHPDEILDILEPSAQVAGQIPLVFIHGGGWVSGTKELYYVGLNKISAKGHRVFNLNYPLAPETVHPHILISLLNALNWIKKEYPSVSKIHIMGDSAGGNLASMLGILVSNPDLLERYFPNTTYSGPQIQTIASLYGVMDRISWQADGFPSATFFTKAYAGADALKPDAVLSVPVTPMDFDADEIKNLPPFFIAIGSTDKLLRSAEMAFARFSKQFDKMFFKNYEGAAHGFFQLGKGSVELHQDVIHFIAEHQS